jgi:hypothetical protein
MLVEQPREKRDQLHRYDNVFELIKSGVTVHAKRPAGNAHLPDWLLVTLALSRPRRMTESDVGRWLRT